MPTNLERRIAALEKDLLRNLSRPVRILVQPADDDEAAWNNYATAVAEAADTGDFVVIVKGA